MRKINRTKLIVTIYVIWNLIGWSLMTWTDWLEETQSRDLFEPCVFGLPIGLFILYIIFQSCFGGIKESFGQKIKYKLLWLGIGSIFGFIINILVFNNIWIVTQDLVGLEHMLNGLEYAVFGMFYVGANGVAWFLFDLIVLIYSKIKNSRGS